MIHLAVTNWGVALACVVTLSITIGVVHEFHCSDYDRGSGVIVARVPPLILFAAYGIVCWFGGGA